MLQAQATEGDPRFADLVAARELSQEMRQRGELRPLRYRLQVSVARRNGRKTSP